MVHKGPCITSSDKEASSESIHFDLLPLFGFCYDPWLNFFKSTWIKRLLCHRGFLAKKVLFAWQISVSPACWTTWWLDFCWNPYLLLIFVSWQESLLKMPMHLSTLKALCQKPQLATNKDLQLFCIPSEIWRSRSSGEMAQLCGTLMQNSRHRLMLLRFF